MDMHERLERDLHLPGFGDDIVRGAKERLRLARETANMPIDPEPPRYKYLARPVSVTLTGSEWRWLRDALLLARYECKRSLYRKAVALERVQLPIETEVREMAALYTEYERYETLYNVVTDKIIDDGLMFRDGEEGDDDDD